MKRQILTLVAILALPALALADLCTDIESQYLQLIAQEEQLANDAIAFSSSSEEQQAIWNTYIIRKSLLESEMTATLTATGCLDSTSGGTDTGDSGTGGDDGPVVSDPGDSTDPGDGGNTGDDGSDGGTDIVATQCHEQLKAVASAAQQDGKSQREVIHLVRSEAHNLGCNFGLYNASTRVPSHLEGKHQSRPTGKAKLASSDNTIVSSPMVNIVETPRRSNGRGLKKGHNR